MASDEPSLPNFVRVEVPKVYGPNEPRHRKLAGIVWGVAALTVTAVITVASILFSDDTAVIVVSASIYLPLVPG